jgi:hypothetical protein
MPAIIRDLGPHRAAAAAIIESRSCNQCARDKLVDMRAALIAKLEHGIDGGDLALLGSVQLGIDAIDCHQEELDPGANR